MWKNARKICSCASIFTMSLAVAIPDPLISKLISAVSVGLANVAIFIKEDV